MQTPQNNIRDEDILQLLQDQRSAELGFRLLMQKYQVQLYQVIRRVVYDHDDTNDVLQNCFIKVFRNIRSFEGKAKLYTWLYRIALNEALTFATQKKRRATQSIEAGEMPLANQLHAASSPDGDALQQRLQDALLQLPEKQRLVFEMRYYDEMPYEQMSEVLQTSVGALKASYHHAVKKIETYFRAFETEAL